MLEQESTQADTTDCLTAHVDGGRILHVAVVNGPNDVRHVTAAESRAARKVVRGRRRIARLYLVLARRLGRRLTQSVLPINGEPGLVSFIDGVPFSAMAFETDGRSILALSNVLNRKS